MTEAALRESTIVGQMGIHPLISARERRREIRLCRPRLRQCVVRGGYDPSRHRSWPRLPCWPGPGMRGTCLRSWLACRTVWWRKSMTMGSASFVAPNPGRRCTPHSIAVNALYQASHPQLRCYPEGVLSTEQTEFHARSNRTAAIRGSQFVPPSRACPGSIRAGGRAISRPAEVVTDLHRQGRSSQYPRRRPRVRPQRRADGPGTA